MDKLPASSFLNKTSSVVLTKDKERKCQSRVSFAVMKIPLEVCLCVCVW